MLIHKNVLFECYLLLIIKFALKQLFYDNLLFLSVDHKNYPIHHHPFYQLLVDITFPLSFILLLHPIKIMPQLHSSKPFEVNYLYDVQA